MNSNRLVLQFIICLLFSGALISHAYEKGQVVPAQKRILHQGFRTDWSDIVGGLSPKYAINSMVELMPRSVIQEYDTSIPFKIAFSFDHRTFTTSWITVNDGNGAYLEAIQFQFTSRDGVLEKMQTIPHYRSRKQSRTPPSHIYLRYHWSTSDTADRATRGFVFLSILSVTTLALSSIVVFKSQNT